MQINTPNPSKSASVIEHKASSLPPIDRAGEGDCGSSLKHQLSWSTARVRLDRITRYMPSWRLEIPSTVAVDLQLSMTVDAATERFTAEQLSVKEAFQKAVKDAIENGTLPHTKTNAADYLGADAHRKIAPELTSTRAADGKFSYFLLPALAPSSYDEFNLISAPNFTRWLSENEQVPTEHVKAWLEAVDVQADAVKPASDVPDISMLATRQQLIDAYGSFTGLNLGWFDNLRDTPALLAARKKRGQGGRGHIIEPLFCPFSVMQWLANPKRKSGCKVSSDKAWEILEKHFPTVYNVYSVGDTRTD